WSDLPGIVRGDMFGAEVEQAVLKQMELQKRHSQQQARDFLKLLTSAEVELLQILVKVGSTNKELAEYLNKSPKTIANQLASIYEKFASFYDLPDERIERSQVIAVLGHIF
ncbi:MAG: LuxR C-terminal-related transcriptional regulator, partial [Anaerolineae bacterium]|nr:LuxR C-terminal-related transcriptional regulator [Anaerolineae bacterium]